MNSTPAMGLDAGEPCGAVPPGFRFHPTDGELVGYYLRKKVASRKIDLDVIRDVDLYRIEPWDLQERCRIGNEEQREWYFFSHKDRKYPTGTRMNRATTAGFWKATGRDKGVYDDGSRLIGMRKTLVFYQGRAPNGRKTDWIMHEFRLQSEETSSPQEEGWVVCRAFKKRSSSTAGHQTAAADVWESSGCAAHEEPSAGGAITDPAADHYRRLARRRPQSFYCKQETETSNHNPSFLQITNNPPFVQLLPRLESPSLTLPQRRNLLALAMSECEEEEQRGGGGRVTDWRALDRFVASQLSQEEAFDRGGAACIAARNSFDAAALLLLQNSGSAEGSDPSELLGSGPLCDFGICMFQK